MKKTFTLNTEPHVAEIGDDTELLFLPEVMGDEFLDGYTRLRDAQKKLGMEGNDLSQVDPSVVRLVVVSLRVFLAGLMLPESATQFAQWHVVVDGTVTGSYSDPDDAHEAAAKLDGATVVDVSMRLPDRVLVQLLEWAVELYGGGTNRPPTSSTGSAQASRSPGTPGRAGSRSKG